MPSGSRAGSVLLSAQQVACPYRISCLGNLPWARGWVFSWSSAGQVSWRSPTGQLRAPEGGVGTREVQVRAGPTSPAGESRAKHSLKQTHHKDAPASPDRQLLLQ